MKAVLVFGILFYILLIEAAEHLFPHPRRYMGACYFDYGGVGHMKKGETKYLSPDACESVTCNKDGSGVVMRCSQGQPEGGQCNNVTAPEDESANYPKCCPIIECWEISSAVFYEDDGN